MDPQGTPIVTSPHVDMSIYLIDSGGESIFGKIDICLKLLILESFFLLNRNNVCPLSL